jgi:hypothetical protein
MAIRPQRGIPVNTTTGRVVVEVSGAGGGGTSETDGQTFTPDTSAGTPVMGVVNPSDTATNGDVVVVAVDEDRNLKVNVVAGGAGGGAMTVADGADVTQGAIADAGVVTDANGTLSAKLRGIVIILLRAFQLGTPLRVDPTGSTAQPVTDGGSSLTIDAASLPLPTGASTAAKQPALGTAGTPSTDVISVQGVASGTVLPISGTVTANLAAGTNNIGDVDVLSLPALPAGTNNIGDVDVLSLPALPAGTNNIGDVDVLTLPALPAGNNNIGDVDAIQSGTWTVQPGNTPNSTPWLVTDTPATSGGLSKFHLVAAASTNATNVKASAGQVFCITAFNLNAAARYLKFHNTSGTPTAGSGVTDTFMIPGNTAGAGVVINIDKGIAFGTGIGISIVTGIADSDATAVAASEIVVNIYYK